MGTDYIIVSEYLKSLREDEELDKIFPLLLTLKGFKIIRTAKEAKGQPQYGKDIIAVGKDNDGIRKRFYFELKGHADKDIDDVTISKQDGIRDSLVALRYVDYTDSSIPGFNELPVKVIFVHNGIIKPNAIPIFEGIIKDLFKDREFERWGIYELADQFGTYLFGEYLLTEEKNISLFKRTLVLLNTPEYDLIDFKDLVQRLLANESKVNSRIFSKLFATLNLLCYLLHHYCKENNNLEPAKQGIAGLILHTWAWIVKHKMHERKPVINQFTKLLATQYALLDEYFQKTLPIAKMTDGLFSERGGPFEDFGYSMRSMQYLADLIYYFQLQQYQPSFSNKLEGDDIKSLESKQLETLFTIIEANIGCKRPLLDRHSKSILLLALFVLQSSQYKKTQKILLSNFIVDCLDNIQLIYITRHRFPEFNDNEKALIEYMSQNKRPHDYVDSSSMLILILIELLVIVDNKEMYLQSRKVFSEKLDLQTVYPNTQQTDVDIEQAFFEGNINEFMAVESSVILPEDFDDFAKQIESKPKFEVDFRCDKAGFSFLKTLSIGYFSNDVFPGEWRKFIGRVKS